ncbi:GNAT family N-acetyltransferase [Urechidicola vernalis]|uniref:GNAT family N-acetyltransferase n=1 Tax=Urechidicola vernalis TaxID=3075600 RepID=A0ABU2Y412_9FLAO|nr:GNAT family N-acetyltransferase [Urechidicola sp. P050]MDT0552937.1 GNAT family N-acetyltransferase [Urechidicola sp. P050]
MILETDRLHILKFTLKDAPFIFELVNSPNWLKFIGDKNVKSLKDAEQYIQEKLLNQYKHFGFSFYLVRTKSKQKPIGMTGFIKRPSMQDVEIGFSFLPNSSGKGYALESSKAILKYGKSHLKIEKVVAITDQKNTRSQKLLERLGLEKQGEIILPDFDKPCSYFEEPKINLI